MLFSYMKKVIVCFNNYYITIFEEKSNVICNFWKLFLISYANVMPLCYDVINVMKIRN